MSFNLRLHVRPVPLCSPYNQLQQHHNSKLAVVLELIEKLQSCRGWLRSCGGFATISATSSRSSTTSTAPHSFSRPSIIPLHPLHESDSEIQELSAPPPSQGLLKHRHQQALQALHAVRRHCLLTAHSAASCSCTASRSCTAASSSGNLSSTESTWPCSTTHRRGSRQRKKNKKKKQSERLKHKPKPS